MPSFNNFKFSVTYWFVAALLAEFWVFFRGVSSIYRNTYSLFGFGFFLSVSTRWSSSWCHRCLITQLVVHPHRDSNQFCIHLVSNSSYSVILSVWVFFLFISIYSTFYFICYQFPVFTMLCHHLAYCLVLGFFPVFSRVIF